MTEIKRSYDRKSQLHIDGTGNVKVVTRFVVYCERLNELCRGSLYPYLDALESNGKSLVQVTTVTYSPETDPYLIALRDIIPRLGNENHRPWWLLKKGVIINNIGYAVEPYDSGKHKELIRSPRSRSKEPKVMQPALF